MVIKKKILQKITGSTNIFSDATTTTTTKNYLRNTKKNSRNTVFELYIKNIKTSGIYFKEISQKHLFGTEIFLLP